MPPEIIAPPITRNVMANSTTSLVCISYGNPIPQIKWTVNGRRPRYGINISTEEIEPKGLYREPVVQSTLQLNEIELRDAGMYKCLSSVPLDVSQSALQTSAQAYLYVSECPRGMSLLLTSSSSLSSSLITFLYSKTNILGNKVDMMYPHILWHGLLSKIRAELGGEKECHGTDWWAMEGKQNACRGVENGCMVNKTIFWDFEQSDKE